MLGVVIWCCQTTGRAIIWCADHGDLAHFDGVPARADGPVLVVGDLVEIDLQVLGSVRRAARLRMVEAGYMPEILDSLTARRRPIAAA